MSKIFINELLAQGKIFEIKGDNHHHLDVIRVRVGDEILVGDKDFNEFKTEIIDFTKKGYRAKVKEPSSNAIIPQRNVTLYISLPKGKKIEDIIYRCSQIGISRIVPVISERTIKRPAAKNCKKVIERWEKKARYGAELSCRKTVPEINNVLIFSEALDHYKQNNFRSGLLLWEEEGGINYITRNDLSEKMAVFIGPEGGFCMKEVEEAKDNGLMIRSLGRLVMEVEPAAIAASALVLCRE